MLVLGPSLSQLLDSAGDPLTHFEAVNATKAATLRVRLPSSPSHRKTEVRVDPTRYSILPKRKQVRVVMLYVIRKSYRNVPTNLALPSPLKLTRYDQNRVKLTEPRKEALYTSPGYQQLRRNAISLSSEQAQELSMKLKYPPMTSVGQSLRATESQPVPEPSARRQMTSVAYTKGSSASSILSAVQSRPK